MGILRCILRIPDDSIRVRNSFQVASVFADLWTGEELRFGIQKHRVDRLYNVEQNGVHFGFPVAELVYSVWELFYLL